MSSSVHVVTGCCPRWLPVGRQNFCWPSPAQPLMASVSSRFMTKILFSNRHIRASKWGFLFDEGGVRESELLYDWRFTVNFSSWRQAHAGSFTSSKSKLCYDRRSVCQSVLVWSTHLGPKTRFLLLSDSCGFVDFGCPIWREDVSLVYNCCWPSPTQSYLPRSQSVVPNNYIYNFTCRHFT
jgi:hypothetical protein